MAVPCPTAQRSEAGGDSARGYFRWRFPATLRNAVKEGGIPPGATSLKIIVVLQVAVPTPVPVGQACHTPQRSEGEWDSARGYLSKELQGH